MSQSPESFRRTETNPAVLAGAPSGGSTVAGEDDDRPSDVCVVSRAPKVVRSGPRADCGSGVPRPLGRSCRHVQGRHGLHPSPEPAIVPAVEECEMGLIIRSIALGTLSVTALAHGGGLNAQGCHNDRKGGTGYHCHRGGASSGSSPRVLGIMGGSSGGATSYASCAAARAAGAAPVRRGDPGYSYKLDRDRDGVGCE